MQQLKAADLVNQRKALFLRQPEQRRSRHGEGPLVPYGTGLAEAEEALAHPPVCGAEVKARETPVLYDTERQESARVPYRAAQRVYDERGLPAAYRPRQQEASFQSAFLPARTSIICAAMEMAISAGVSAFMSRPMGVVMRAKSSSVKPCSRSWRCTPAVLALLPMTPM